jgi:hypothetical protein
MVIRTVVTFAAWRFDGEGQIEGMQAETPWMGWGRG